MKIESREKHHFSPARWLWLRLLIVVSTSWRSAAAAGPCEAGLARFDGVAPLHYANVIGEPGARIYLHATIPVQCTSVDKACGARRYLVSGDKVAVGKFCDSWAQVQYIGDKTVSYGWIESHSLSAPDMPPSKNAGEVHYEFRLKAGAGTPVCEAYLQRLNQSTYLYPPYCRWDVSQSDATPEFSPVKREPLAPEQLWALIGKGYEFLGSQEDNRTRAALRRYDSAGNLVYDPDYSLADVRAILAGTHPSGLNFSAWLYPKIDINNNQKPVATMLWVGGVTARATCTPGWDPAVTRGSNRYQSYAFILRSNNSDVNDIETRAVFGSDRNPPIGQQFMPVGDDIEFFSYRNAIYFDSFRAASRDEVEGRSRSSRYRTLEVFQRHGTENKRICSYEVGFNPID